MDFKDYYGVLGVARDATAQEVKRAFRRLARKFHPDVSKEAGAAVRMAEVNEAYAVLSDPERRAAYDNLAHGRRAGEPFKPPPDWDAGFEFSGPGPQRADDFSDFFAQLFGRAARRAANAGPGAHARGPGPPGQGEDHHARVVLELADAWSGARRQIHLRHPGLGPDGHLRLVERSLEVGIPAGVRPGQLIRLAGQGGPGSPPGDLFLEVQLRPHPRFRVDGTTLVADLPVAPWEAALGAVVPVTLPDGSTLKVRVPAGAQAGQVLTVRDKGLPGKRPDDLELLVQVLLPSAQDPRARHLYEAMARALTDFDARKVAHAAREREASP